MTGNRRSPNMGVAGAGVESPDRAQALRKPRAQPTPAALEASSTRSVVKDIQALLGQAGFDVGVADGRMGAKTRAAIIRYQQENRLPIDGTPSPQLLEHLKSRNT